VTKSIQVTSTTSCQVPAKLLAYFPDNASFAVESVSQSSKKQKIPSKTQKIPPTAHSQLCFIATSN
jgi:hypothetical protein